MMRALVGFAVCLLLIGSALAQNGVGPGHGLSQEQCFNRTNGKFDPQQDFRRRRDATTRCEQGKFPGIRYGAGARSAGAEGNGSGGPAFEKAREACRARFRPQVVACVKSHVAAGGGGPEQYRAGCIEAVMPQGRACVVTMMHGGR